MNFLFSTPAKVCRCGTSIKLSTFIILCVCVEEFHTLSKNETEVQCFSGKLF